MWQIIYLTPGDLTLTYFVFHFITVTGYLNTTAFKKYLWEVNTRPLSISVGM